MPKRLLVFLAVPWVLLWLLMSLQEIPLYIHDPARPAWQPVALLCSSLVSAIAAFAVWQRSGAFQKISLEAPARWLVPALSWMPAYAAGILALNYGMRHAVFALAGTRYEWTQSDLRPAFQFVKVALFYALWIGLAFGAKMFTAMRESDVATQSAKPERLLIPVGDKQRLIETNSIHWIEADDNYVRIHTGGHDYAVRKTLQDMLSELGTDRFIRIHKSAAVNLAEIQSVQPIARGDAEITLRSGAKLRVSRRFRQELQRQIAS